MKCFLCESDGRDPIFKLSDEKFEVVKEFAKLRAQYGDAKITDLASRCEKACFSEDLGYHKTCFLEIRSEEKLDRCKKRFEKCEKEGATTLQRKRGRPASLPSSETLLSKVRRRSDNFDSSKCVLCQMEDHQAVLHEVQTIAVGEKLRNIALSARDDCVKARLSDLVASNDPLNAVAQEMKYHLHCLVKYDRESKENPSKVEDDHNQNLIKLISIEELIHVVRKELSVPEKILNMNEINTAFIDILEGNGYQNFCESKNYKKYLKTLLSKAIPTIDFSKCTIRKMPEKVTLKSTKDVAVSVFDEDSKIEDELPCIFKAAAILRAHILKSPKWAFKGNFDDFKIPPLLSEFCKLLSFGTRKIGEVEKEQSFQNKQVMIMSQFIMQSMKSKDQKVDTNFVRETPLSVGLGLRVHNETRSKSLLQVLERLHITVSYDRILEIETDVAGAISERGLESNIFVPTCIKRDNFAWFAIDNIDFLEHTPTGADTFHGTVTAIYQKTDDLEPAEPLVLKRESKRTSLEKEIDVKIEQCPKAIIKPIILPYNVNDEAAQLYTKKHISLDQIWAASLCDDKYRIPLTWSAFHSALSPSQPNTQVCLMAPLLKSPPSNFDILYSALQRAREMNNTITPDSLTVIVMDMQLYEMAMKLWISSEDLKRKFIFRPGELHTVFWALSALGSYIEGSGIDQAWMEAGIYSSKVIASILNGKNMYRCLEAHFITFLSFFKLSMQNLEKGNTSLFHEVAQVIEKLRVAYDNKNLETEVGELLENFEGVSERLSMYESTLPKLQIFILNYMKQFSIILQFIKASRQNNFELHLKCTELLCKYFFAHDHINYSRMLPVYLSSMAYVEKNYPETFQMFKNGYFSVSKNKVPFTSIGSDHALEHENRKLKVQGGLVNITQKPKTLDRFFLIAPEMLKIISDFDELFQITNSTTQLHHELSGSKLKRILAYVDNLSQTFITHGDPFENEDDEIYNIMTRKVLPSEFECDVLNRDKIGQELFEKFVLERLNEGRVGIWDPLKKTHLKCFKNVNVEKEIRMDNKLVKIKEERNLLQRFVIASRSRPDLDIKTAIGNYEFGVVPRSLFALDGTFFLATDKSKILHRLEELAYSQGITIYEDQKSKPEVVIIDGMAFLHTISKTNDMVTMEDYFTAFLTKLLHVSGNFSGVRLVFDRYIENSLKDQTRQKRAEGKSSYFHITDKTVIRNILLKELFSNWKTKGELVEYLSTKLLKYATESPDSLKNLMVTYGTKTVGNIPIPPLLQRHNHEEADTLIILNLYALLDKGYNATVISPDTDIFIFLLYFFKKLSMEIVFTTGFGQSARKILVSPIHHMLGHIKTDALLFFHSFTGSDLTGKFAGKTKDSSFRTFLNASDTILKTFAHLTSGKKLKEEDMADLQRFICQLYKQPKFETIPDLRWFLFSNKGSQGEDLPPTLGSLRPHILRSQYVANMWAQSHKNELTLPPVSEYGWEVNSNGKIVPIMCLEESAPKAILQLIKCGCKKKCMGRCSCAKNGLECTDLCTCMNCENTKRMNAEMSDYSSEDDM